MKQVGFGYGALRDNLERQANAQGYTLGKEAELLDKLMFALNMVRIHGVLTEGQADKAYEKLNKKVIAALKPRPKSPEPEGSENDG